MRFSKDDEVYQKGRPEDRGLVRGLGLRVAGVQFYDVFWGGQRGTTRVAETDLEKYVGRKLPLENLAEGVLQGAEALQQRIVLERLSRLNPLRNNILAFNSSRTRFYPYQFKPLLKFLESRRHRLLIADEVGLGKTIEAGLILTEVRARQSLRLSLVTCPAALLQKWRGELRDRFGERFRIMRSRDFLDFLGEYEEAPERATVDAIVSHESLRSDRVRARLEQLRVPFDFVVVDEAHAARNPTSTRRAIELVGEGAGALLLLTATPIQLGQRDLFSLLNLLDAEDFPDERSAQNRFRDNEHLVLAQAVLSGQPPDLAAAEEHIRLASQSPWLTKEALLSSTMQRIRHYRANDAELPSSERAALIRDVAELNLLSHIVTRTRRRDQHAFAAVRRAENISVRFSDHEQSLYDAVTELISLAAKTYRSISPSLAWRLTTPQRRMASSMPAMVAFFRENPPAWMVADDWDPEAHREIGADASGSEQDEALRSTLATQIRELVARFPLDAPDAKYDNLLQLIRSGSQKLLLFATFRHTLRYLSDRLKRDGISAELITGEADAEERNEAIARFRDTGSVRVLLSSRVGSEGLDFQFCSSVVNYDLPWNPMEVEQRIGRLDRIGQKAPTIQIANFWTVGTIEEKVLLRLYDRIGVFKRSIGELESILGDELAGDLQTLLKPELSAKERESRTEQLLLIVENRKQQIRTLELSAAQFIGIDTFFDEEIAAIQDRRRYITPVQLLRFVEAFVRNHAPHTRLVIDKESMVGTITIDASIQKLLRKHDVGSSETALLLNVGYPVPVTFDGSVAEARPDLELIRPVHPLVQAIASELGDTTPSLAYDVSLRTERIGTGTYFFGVFKTIVNAARQYSILECVILDEDLHVACDADIAEGVLGEMVEKGSSSPGVLAMDTELRRKAAGSIERVYLERRETVRARESQGNEAFVEQRLASLRQHLSGLQDRDRELLKRAEAAKQQERYLRMLRGRIANRERDLARKEAELNGLREVAIEHVQVAAGILEVTQSG